ncbi:trypsin-like serine peptidase [Jannaschia ovalis]|uniref:Serine protease n=1 Tax=Jannaschia ovalis TaxID=3038773 RepID=A0ABY8LE51_9RHOB|nr:trypsin-like peptidase domain-containing protein [Jannaschia sp. GRR-S6-38]WGH79581.1 trypsin-like peptidase domain-containing protein [Jannaschia sp. GRR-S6-38]
MLRLAILLALAAVLCGPQARAQSEASQSRVLATSADLRGLEAVGRLDLGRTGFCTGALVSPTLVLTAAHCVFDARSGHPHPIDTMTFRAGLAYGASFASRGVRRMVIDPAYRNVATVDLENVARDLALLELDQSLDLPGIRPFPAAGRLSRGDRVTLASYGRDRAEAPTLESGCRVLDRDSKVMLLDCDVDFGSSGAPVLIATPAGPQIVSVISAMSEGTDGRRIALAVAVEQGLARLVGEFARSPVLRPDAKRLSGTGEDRGTIRFIRPGD